MRRVTMEDVAREAGVSRALVSMAFRDAKGVGAETRERILATAERLGYRVNTVASRLASRSTRTFGVFLLDLRLDAYADMFDGIRAVAAEHTTPLILAVGKSDGSLDAQELGNLAASRVDVILATGLLLPDDEVRRINAAVPVVSVARMIGGIDSVSTDNFEGGRLATDHLVGLGHRRVAFLANPQTDGYTGRQEGYLSSMRAAGLAPTVVKSRYSRHEAAADIGPLLSRPPGERPTAVFAHNDQAALGVLDAMAALGLRTPGDVSVVGYDNAQASRAPGTALTTVDVKGQWLGEQAAHAALARATRPAEPATSVVTSPQLVVRSTTGAPPQD